MKNVNRISRLFVTLLFISLASAQPGRDVSDTEVNGVAFRAENDPHTTFEFTVNIVSSDFNWADGVRFTFPENVNILGGYVADELADSAAVIISDNEILFGDSTDGVFDGDGIFGVDNEYTFVVHTNASVQAPMDINYTVYDDGWAQDFCINDNNCEQCNDYGWGIDCDGNYLTVVLNAEGVVLIDEIDLIAPENQDPVIMDIVDVDNDQGKQMIMSWHPGDLIDLPYFTEFSVHRYSPDPTDATSIVTGTFYGEYFSNPGSGGSPDFGELILTREDSLINLNFDQTPLPVNDDFQVRWTSDIYAPVSGDYDFRTHSDDGVRLYIDGEAVIDHWFEQGPTSRFGTINLSEGSHSLVLEYYENGGGAQCYLYWTPPSGVESLVTPSTAIVEVSELGTWDYLSTIPWTGHDPYAVLVNTLEDKISTAFRVTAHTDDPNLFFHSEPVLGRSYDNIAPAPPSGLVATVSDTIVSLSWNPASAEDFNYYSVHRSLNSNFQPNLSNFISYSTTAMVSDSTAPWNVPLFYKVSATDMGGNLGPGSVGASAHIYVNRAPQAYDVAISPSVPLEGDDIVASYIFYDPDGDQESGTTFAWYNNEVLVPQHTGSTLSSTFTVCGDDWRVVVTPSDGSLSGLPLGSNNVIVCGANTPPEWSTTIDPLYIDEDSQNNIFEMGGYAFDTEQATSQLVFSVTGNTNESVLAASFDGSKLFLSAVSGDFNASPAATLTLRVDDGGEIADTYVDVSIDSVNDVPAVVEYSGRYDFDEDESYLFEIYDFMIEDPDNDAVDMVMSILPGENYAQAVDTPGLINAPPNFNGQISVQIEISDGSGGFTITTIPMSVLPVNDPAYMTTTGMNVIDNGPATEEQEYSLTVSWKDPDGTEDASVYDVSVGGPVANWLDIANVYSSGDGPDLEYSAILSGTPDDINMPENDISFSVVDNSEGQQEAFTEYFYIATVSVNDAPVVESYTGLMELEEEGSHSFSVDKFAVADPDNSPIDFSVTVSEGDNYTVGSDSVTIFPIENYNGELSVDVSLSDGDKSDNMEVSLTVTPVNDALVLSDVVDGVATEEASFSTSLSWTDIDGAGADAYGVSLDGDAAEWLSAGPVTVSGDSGSTENSNIGGSLSYSIVLSGVPDDENLFQNDISISVIDNSEGDPISLTAYLTVDVLPVNDAPTVSGYAVAAQVNEDESFTASINDFVVEDVDSDFPFDFDFHAVAGEHYTVASDSISIAPSENYNGVLSVNYMISDGMVDVAVAVPVEVLPVNDDPVLSSYVGSTSLDEDTNLTLSGADFSVSDPDNASSYLIFDGQNDYVETNLSINNIPYTIACRFKSDVNEGEHSLVDTDIGGQHGNSIILGYGNGDNTIDVQYHNGYYNSPFIYQPDTWYDVVATYDNGVVKLYVDGEYVGTQSFNQSNPDGSTVRFGRHNAGDPQWFDGTMSDVAIWDVALSEQSVTDLDNDLYDVWNIVNSSHLIGYWDFSEGTGSIVYDLSGNGNNGTIYGDAVWENLNNEYSVQLEEGQNYNVSMDGASIIPDENYNGQLNVSASVMDLDGGLSNTISFNLTVDPVNDVPMVQDLAISPAVPDFGDSLVVTYAFSDIDGDTESGTVIQWYKNSELQSGETSDTLSFNSTLCDEVWYAVVTPGDGTASGTSYTTNSVAICGENTPPEWTWSGPVRLYEDSTKVVDLYSNMVDNEQAPSQVSYTILSQANPSVVTATIDGHELHLATVIADYTQAYADTLTLEADDGGYQDTSDVVINIAPVNDAPVAVDDSYSIDEGGFVVGGADEGFLVNDVDIDGDVLQIAMVDDPVNGVVQLNTDWSFSYSHDGSETSSDAFTYMAFDGEYFSNEATVSITIAPVNDSPVITYAATFETVEETPFDVIIGDFIIEDPDADTGSISIQISDGENYTAAAITDGYTITPAENFSGGLVIPVIAFDGDSSSAVWELFVEVIGGNDAPVVVNAAGDISVDEDEEDILISLSGSETAPYFSDSDGDNLSFDAHTAGSGLVAAMIDGDTLHISFTENAFGVDTLFVSATDVSGESVSDTVLVSVVSVNDAPVILTAAYFVTDEEDSIHISINDFVYYDIDTDSTGLSLVLSDGDGYSLESITNGYALTPDPNVSDTLYVPSVISDGDTASAVWDLMVIVQPDNDAPVVVNPEPDISVDEDAEDVVIALMGNETAPYFADADGDSLDFMVYVDGSGVVSASVQMDQLHISFFQNMYGSDTLFITATDPSGDSAEDTILVTVNAVNDPPIIVDAISFQTYEDDSLDISIYDFVIRDEDTWDEDAFSIDITAADDNYSLGFDGVDDYVQLPEGIVSDVNSFTFMCWFKTDVNNEWARIMDFGSGTDVNMFLTTSHSATNSPRFAIKKAGEGEQQLTAPSPLEQGQWYHIAYTIDDETSTGMLYIDGELVAENYSMTNSPSDLGSTTSNYFGKSQYNDPYLGGSLDNAMMWSRALSQSEIESFMSGPNGNLSNDIIGHWNFNAGSGDIAFDASSGHNDGMIHGATWQLMGESTRDDFVILPIEDGFRIIPNENFFGDIPLVVTAFDGMSYSEPYYTTFSVIPVNDIPEIVNPLADISVEEDADTMIVSLVGTETVPYYVDVDGDSIEFEVQVTGSDVFHLMVDGTEMEISFPENMHGSDSIYVSGTDGSGAFVVDTIVVTVSSVNDVPTAFSLLSPEDSTEVIITAASVAQNLSIDVSWTPSSDADGDTVGYGFVLFSGPYTVSTPALYTVDIPITALSIPYSAAIALLETAGYQLLTCDWMVFATDGQDTTASTEIRTITIDARPVLSTDELAIPEVFALHQNYPNPFNPSTRIKYDLPEAQNVQIMVYDIMGRKVRTLINEYQHIGYRTIRWDATDDYGRGVSAGMYVYTIQAGDFRQVRKMVLLK